MTAQSDYARYPSLKDRAVLITGGASGIGAEIVTHFVDQGARVAFVDIDADGAGRLIDRLGEEGCAHRPVFLRSDVTDLEQFQTDIAALDGQLGGFDVLVNNAANDQRHAIEDVTPAFWRDGMSVNLDHQFFAAQSVAKGMKERRRGAIINMGSCSWRLGLDQLSVYVTAKAAIEGMTNGLARELGAFGIRVNCVIPGFIKTDRQVTLWLTPELEAIVMDGQCLKELIEPVYVANLIAFLASDDARMCSSGTYTVDGGWI